LFIKPIKKLSFLLLFEGCSFVALLFDLDFRKIHFKVTSLNVTGLSIFLMQSLGCKYDLL